MTPERLKHICQRLGFSLGKMGRVMGLSDNNQSAARMLRPREAGTGRIYLSEARAATYIAGAAPDKAIPQFLIGQNLHAATEDYDPEMLVHNHYSRFLGFVVTPDSVPNECTWVAIHPELVLMVGKWIDHPQPDDQERLESVLKQAAAAYRDHLSAELGCLQAPMTTGIPGLEEARQYQIPTDIPFPLLTFTSNGEVEIDANLLLKAFAKVNHITVELEEYQLLFLLMVWYEQAKEQHGFYSHVIEALKAESALDDLYWLSPRLRPSGCIKIQSSHHCIA